MSNRAAIHLAVDALLDALDVYRAPPVDELVKVRDLPLERRAVADLVRSGALRTVVVGRERWTRRSWLDAAVDALPVATTAERTDEIAAAASKRAARRSA